uniref:Uncharacterized protein n=1 Tax=Timema bartmani TaxID=61472 RepID=A0A7R9F5Y5_9NEOP|nr:unnamed protein product [Timema bartmani]
MANALVVVSSIAEDGEIEVRVSVGGVQEVSREMQLYLLGVLLGASLVIATCPEKAAKSNFEPTRFEQNPSNRFGSVARDRQTDKHTDMLIDRWTDRWTYIQIDMVTNRQTDRHDERQMDIHTDRHGDKQTNRQT